MSEHCPESDPLRDRAVRAAVEVAEAFSAYFSCEVEFQQRHGLTIGPSGANDDQLLGKWTDLLVAYKNYHDLLEELDKDEVIYRGVSGWRNEGE